MSHEQIDEQIVPQIPIARNVKLKFDWSDVKAKLLDVAAQGFLTAFGGDGISTALSALTSVAGGLKIDAEPGEKAWSLTIFSFAWAFDEIKTMPSVEIEILRKNVHSVLEDAKIKVENGNYYVPVTFLERPNTLPLYREMRDALVRKKAFFRNGVNETESMLSARIDCAFERAVFEILSRKSDVYQSLFDALDPPGRQGAEKRLGWLAYRKRLINYFEVSPVFGQETLKLSLAQLYVPLRGVWPKHKDYQQSDDLPMMSTHNICMIEDRILDWLSERSDGSDIILIGGGPGSGKSTSLKAIARRSASLPDWYTLFIPLQYISLEGDLRDSINRYFVDRTGGSFSQPPLTRAAVEDGPPFLLIFDGLDELSRPGEGAAEVVNLFSIKLANLLASLRGDGVHTVKVVVSGRMPAFQVAKRYISPPLGSCLEVYGYTSAISGFAPDPKNLWSIDQRQQWWENYSKLIGADESVPEAFKSDQLKGITHEPLLCYLLVLSGFATGNWEQAAENPNRIYKNLIDSIWNRGWGDGLQKRQGAGKTLSQSDFNSLMQTIALAAWQGGDTRVASESGFNTAITLARTEKAWENFKADNGTDVTNLAMNFYLKSSEGSQRGFEFTHKSFGDYLAARAIIDIAVELPPLINRNVEFAMVEWLRATGNGTLTPEILHFLRDELRLRLQGEIAEFDIDRVEKLKKSFERLISSILADGLPAEKVASNWRSAESMQRNSEVMAWAMLNGLIFALLRGGVDRVLAEIEWPDPRKSLKYLLRRFSDISESDNTSFACFACVSAPGADLFELSLMDIDFQGANLEGSNLSGCHLIRANLEGANLREARLERAMLDYAILDKACLVRADLSDARLHGTQWGGANLDEAKITEGTLLYCDLDYFEKISSRLRTARQIRGSLVGGGDAKHMYRIKKLLKPMFEAD